MSVYRYISIGWRYGDITAVSPISVVLNFIVLLNAAIHIPGAVRMYIYVYTYMGGPAPHPPQLINCPQVPTNPGKKQDTTNENKEQK